MSEKAACFRETEQGLTLSKVYLNRKLIFSS